MLLRLGRVALVACVLILAFLAGVWCRGSLVSPEPEPDPPLAPSQRPPPAEATSRPVESGNAAGALSQETQQHERIGLA